MDYFALYDLPRSFTPDAAAVKKKYLLFSRLYHPDRFATATPVESNEALKQSAISNAAYRILTNPDSTMAYLLKLQGVLEDEEKYVLPPAFLMEMMELNEAVDDFNDTKTAAAKEAAGAAIAEFESAWQAGVAPLVDRYEKGDQSHDLLLKIKDYYFRKKYLARIKGRL